MAAAEDTPPGFFVGWFPNGCVICLFQALRDWVAVESDSSNVLRRPELHRMMEMVAQKLQQMGGAVESVDVGDQEVRNEMNFSRSTGPLVHFLELMIITVPKIFHDFKRKVYLFKEVQKKSCFYKIILTI